MFDLEKSMESWRASLPAEMLGRGEQVEELEQHLRDAFDERVEAGDAPEAAWAAAVASMGATQQLASEFRKLDRAARVWIPAWLAVGAMAFVVISVSLLVVLGSRFRGPLLATHVVCVTTGYSAVFAVGFLAAVAVLSRAWFGWDGQQDRSMRLAGGLLAGLSVAATAPGVILGAVWAHEHMGRWWGWDPKEVGAVCVLAWGVILLKSFLARTTPPQMLMLLGVVGNVVVASGWFGPALMTQGHVYGNGISLIGALLGGFLILQMGLVYLVLLPPRVLRGGSVEANV